MKNLETIKIRLIGSLDEEVLGDYSRRSAGQKKYSEASFFSQETITIFMKLENTLAEFSYLKGQTLYMIS